MWFGHSGAKVQSGKLWDKIGHTTLGGFYRTQEAHYFCRGRLSSGIRTPKTWIIDYPEFKIFSALVLPRMESLSKGFFSRSHYVAESVCEQTFCQRFFFLSLTAWLDTITNQIVTDSKLGLKTFSLEINRLFPNLHLTSTGFFCRTKPNVSFD